MDKKQAYEKKARAELDLLQARLDELKAKARKAAADAEINYHQQIDELKAKRDSTQDYLAELGRAGQDTWGELKEGVNRAISELKSGLDQAASRLK